MPGGQGRARSASSWWSRWSRESPPRVAPSDFYCCDRCPAICTGPADDAGRSPCRVREARSASGVGTGRSERVGCPARRSWRGKDSAPGVRDGPRRWLPRRPCCGRGVGDGAAVRWSRSIRGGHGGRGQVRVSLGRRPRASQRLRDRANVLRPSVPRTPGHPTLQRAWPATATTIEETRNNTAVCASVQECPLTRDVLRPAARRCLCAP